MTKRVSTSPSSSSPAPSFNLEPGLLWVEKRIRELVAELGRPVNCLEWPRPGDPTIPRSFKANTIPLRIWRGGEFQIIEFKRGEFRDVGVSKEIQRRLGERIREDLMRTTRA